MRTPWRRLPLLLLLAGLTTCSDGAEPAGPGWLNVRVSSPHPDDGGVMFRVQGGPIDSVRAAFPDAFTSRVSASEWRVIVIGNVASAVVARVWVPDLDAVAQYSAVLEQAASGTTYAQRPTADYTLTVER